MRTGWFRRMVWIETLSDWQLEFVTLYESEFCWDNELWVLGYCVKRWLS